ncbi:MAG TPA: complex I subunit 1 family protein [Planctomycetota bacterium]|nr:complex I subunit 1 family protein [Planctomycetota bacterium]
MTPTLSFFWLPDALAVKLIPVAIVFGGLLGIVPLLVFLERKICAWIQDRVGPNRVGVLGPDSPLEIFGIKSGKTRFLGGLMQPLADAVKLIFKEAFVPAGADRLLFALGPFFALMPPLLAFIVMPVGPDFHAWGQTIKLQVADLNVGILWVLGVASLSAYGLAFGGWASNNKFALIGGVRAMAQMVSYEIGMGLVILSMIMHYDSVSLRTMAYIQSDPNGTCPLGGLCTWGIWHQQLAFILFTICAFAENNRLPFDLPECEAELVGGYHTEYNSMHFGMYFQGEYIAMLSMGALITTMFLGGWHYPGFNTLKVDHEYIAAILGLISFGTKVFAFIAFSMWVRWTLPRFRWDQLMSIGWKGIVPLALANLVITAYVHLPVEPKSAKSENEKPVAALRAQP